MWTDLEPKGLLNNTQHNADHLLAIVSYAFPYSALSSDDLIGYQAEEESIEEDIVSALGGRSWREILKTGIGLEGSSYALVRPEAMCALLPILMFRLRNGALELSPLLVEHLTGSSSSLPYWESTLGFSDLLQLHAIKEYIRFAPGDWKTSESAWAFIVSFLTRSGSDLVSLHKD